jgi:hypothetical protein
MSLSFCAQRRTRNHNLVILSAAKNPLLHSLPGIPEGNLLLAIEPTPFRRDNGGVTQLPITVDLRCAPATRC